MKTNIAQNMPRPRSGHALVYLMIAWLAICAFVSLAVDLGHVHLAKAQLQVAADAAARYAVSGIPNGLTDVRARATTAGAYNKVDGTPLALTTADVDMGTWNAATKVFTVTTTNANAVRIRARRLSSRGTAIPLYFARLLGAQTCDINATAIARLTGATTTTNVPGFANPYLAGMPNGNYGGADVSGTAPTNSPIPITSVALTPGSDLSFSVSGSCADDPVNVNKAWTPDGCSDGTGIRTNDSGYLNGMSQLTTQQGALVGVFLDNNPPTTGSAPAALDMSSQSAMNYSTLQPALKQVFFIGDGRRNDNGNVQQVRVPAGATRLFLGMHDNINWANNSGYLLVTIGTSAPTINTVK